MIIIICDKFQKHCFHLRLPLSVTSRRSKSVPRATRSACGSRANTARQST